MSTNYRAELQDLHTSIQLYTGLNPAAADVHPADLTRRLMDAMAASAAALAQPEPVVPTAEQQARDLLERMGIADAQSFSAGDLIELANLIARAAIAADHARRHG